MTFGAARALSEAFGKGEAETPPSETPVQSKPPVSPASENTDSSKNAESAETPAVKAPDADALAELLGGPKVKPKVEETDELPAELQNATDKAKNVWAEQRRALKEEKRRREELEARIAEIEKNKGVAPDEVNQLKEQLNSYEQELRVARVEATKEYKEAVVTPRQQIDEVVTALAKKYETEVSDIRKALEESDPERQSDLLSEAASTMNDRDRFRLYEMADKWRKVENIRTRVLANAKEALEKIETHRAEQEKQFAEQQSKQYAHTLEKTWGDLTAKAPIFRRRDGDEAWNAQIAEIEKSAASLNPAVLQDHGTMAGVAVKAAAAPFLYGLVQTLYGQLQETKTALSKYQQAAPGAGGGAPDPSIGTGTAPKTEYEDFASAIRAGLAG